MALFVLKQISMAISEEVLKKAWGMRQKGCYSMREIATKLNVGREQLIDELEAWLKKQN